MAFVTGTETGIDALFNRLVTEITSNTDLANASPPQTWMQVWNAGDQYVFKGPGMAGGDNIYVGLEKVKDSGNTIYEIRAYGMTGYNASAADMLGHVNVSKMARLLTSDDAMTYWLVASGRRFVFVVKVSTYYEAMYGGFFLPFLTPAEYPYPLFIGGSAGPIEGSDDPTRWNDAVDSHRVFTDPEEEYSVGSTQRSSSARLLPPGGIWSLVNHYDDDPRAYIMFPTVHGESLDHDTSNNIYDRWWKDDVTEKMWSHMVVRKSRQCLGGAYPVTPIHLVSLDEYQALGALDSVYRVPANGLTAEAAITIDGDPAIAFPNVWRQDAPDMWALKTI